MQGRSINAYKKICGITSITAAKVAQECGADYIGLVFAKSKRQLKLTEAKQIAAAVPGIMKVGVFADAPVQEVNYAAECCKLDVIKLHGSESAEYCHEVNRPVIKAVRADCAINPAAVQNYNGFPVEWILLDSCTPTQFGGVGKPFDWAGLQAVRRLFTKPVVLAGGLNKNNVNRGISILQPYGVDVSGGVETNGFKDIVKIREFIGVVRKGSEDYGRNY